MCRMTNWIRAIFKTHPARNGHDEITHYIEEQITSGAETRARDKVQTSQDEVCKVAEQVIRRIAGQR